MIGERALLEVNSKIVDEVERLSGEDRPGQDDWRTLEGISNDGYRAHQEKIVRAALEELEQPGTTYANLLASAFSIGFDVGWVAHRDRDELEELEERDAA